MIEIVGLSTKDEGYNCPAFVCDTCRVQVVGRGNVVWGSTSGFDGVPARQTPLYVVHKGGCDTAFTRWFKEAYPESDGWMQLWDELSTVVNQLTHNTEKPISKTEGKLTYYPLAFPKEV